MFLPVSDKMQNLLTDALKTEDNFIKSQQKGKRRNQQDLISTSHLQEFEKMMYEIGKGQFKFRVDESGKSKARDLRGPEKVKLFQNRDKVMAVLEICTKTISDREKNVISSLWTDFYVIIQSLKSFPCVLGIRHTRTIKS